MSENIRVRSNGVIEVPNARLRFRNFRGQARQYNEEGDRNFNLVLDEEQKAVFEEEGFKVRTRPPRDEYSDPEYLLQISVSYKNRPPKVVMITSGNKTELDEETVGELDYAEIENVDVSVRPYHWSMSSGRSGVKGYLNSLYVTLVEDDFDGKYADRDE